MCGIFGYAGKKDAGRIIVEGLKRLEYRGYDSWGVALVSKEGIEVIKKVGAIGDFKELEELPLSNIGIGHTRWATHGGVTNVNAHPHFSSDKSFVVAQNGIVENYQELKKELLKKNHKFITETDTEVIVRLIEEQLKVTKNLFEAIREAFILLKGRNTIIVLPTSGKEVYAVRNGSPLVIGISKGEIYITSDTLSFSNKTNRAIYLNNYEMVVYKSDTDKLDIFNVNNGNKISYQESIINQENVDIETEGHSHYMIKEIFEQKDTIRNAVKYSMDDLQEIICAIKNAKNVYTVGAGTAGFAAGQIAYFLRKIAGIQVTELKSYDIDSYRDIFCQEDLIIAISQSGETADTIEAVEHAKSKGVKVASLVNMQGSTLTRISDYPFLSRSGPEICVASTKAFTSQISWGFLLAMSLISKHELAHNEIYRISELLENAFNPTKFVETEKVIQNIVKNFKDKEHFFVLGKGQNFYIALEGSLKIKEITYKHFEGFSAGELKHGVIALIEKDTPVIVIISDDEYKEDMLSAAAQVKARGAFVVGIADDDNQLFDIFVETSKSELIDSLTKIIPFQLISYYLGIELGNNPDKPRNLAKSVTVK